MLHRIFSQSSQIDWENKVVNVDLTKESDEGRRESKSLLLQTLKQIGAGRM
jgi:hypothetical protein